jgi:hypothetical protein
VSQPEKTHKKIPVGLRRTGIFLSENESLKMFEDPKVIALFFRVHS